MSARVYIYTNSELPESSVYHYNQLKHVNWSDNVFVIQYLLNKERARTLIIIIIDCWLYVLCKHWHKQITLISSKMKMKLLNTDIDLLLTARETKERKKKTSKCEHDKYANIFGDVRVIHSGHEGLGYACPCLLLSRLQNALLILRTHVLILFYYYRLFCENRVKFTMWLTQKCQGVRVAFQVQQNQRNHVSVVRSK